MAGKCNKTNGILPDKWFITQVVYLLEMQTEKRTGGDYLFTDNAENISHYTEPDQT